MNLSTLMILSTLACLVVLPAAGESLVSGISAAAATTDSPPYAVSVYIHDAQAAVAERNWTYALLLTTRGLAFYPENADLLSLQGYTYRKTGQYEKSVDALSKSIRADPTPIRYAGRGYGYLALKNYSAALADARTGMTLNQSEPLVFGVKALALQGLGRTDEALAAIDTAIVLTPGNAHYWQVKGELLADKGNCTGAAGMLEKSLALDPDYDLPFPTYAGARMSLAAIHERCTTPAPSALLPVRSPVDGIALIGILGAMLVFRDRK